MNTSFATGFTVKVTDISGRVIDTFDLASTSPQLTFGKDYANGAYMVFVNSGKGVHAHKLVKL